MNSQEILDQIKAEILEKNICPDLAKQATQLVFGSGNPNARVVFIGEAPGKKEDLTGEPFVGASGKFLDEMLASINMNRSDIYITNIVKYRPPNNRDPLPEEKAAFLPYLYAQLAAINPKVVITLGRHSTNCFLPGVLDLRQNKPSSVSSRKAKSNISSTKLPEGSVASDNISSDLPVDKPEERLVPRKASMQISHIHGQPQNIKIVDAGRELSLIILPLYHPAAALYNGGLRQTLLDDFAKVPAILHKI